MGVQVSTVKHVRQFPVLGRLVYLVCILALLDYCHLAVNAIFFLEIFSHIGKPLIRRYRVRAPFPGDVILVCHHPNLQPGRAQGIFVALPFHIKHTGGACAQKHGQRSGYLQDPLPFPAPYLRLHIQRVPFDQRLRKLFRILETDILFQGHSAHHRIADAYGNRRVRFVKGDQVILVEPVCSLFRLNAGQSKIHHGAHGINIGIRTPLPLRIVKLRGRIARGKGIVFPLHPG